MVLTDLLPLVFLLQVPAALPLMETQAVAALVRSLVLVVNSPEAFGSFESLTSLSVLSPLSWGHGWLLVGFYEARELSAQLGLQQRMLHAQLEGREVLTPQLPPVCEQRQTKQVRRFAAFLKVPVAPPSLWAFLPVHQSSLPCLSEAVHRVLSVLANSVPW